MAYSVDDERRTTASSVRIANDHTGGTPEVAAEHVENGVRRATNDCVQKTPKKLVVEHPDAGAKVVTHSRDSHF